MLGRSQQIVDIPLRQTSGLKVIKKNSCSAQVSMKFFLLINVIMSTIGCILTFISRKNSIVGLSQPEKAEFLDILYL